MLEWEADGITLDTPQGTLSFNEAITTNDLMLLLNPAKCSMRPDLRIETDDVPQEDGTILHDQFKTGMILKLAVLLSATREVAACGEDLCTLDDLLHLHLNALVNPTLDSLEAGDARFGWTPGCGDARIIDRLKLLEWPEFELTDGGVWEATFALHSGFPTALAAAQTDTTLEAPTSVTNRGNAQSWPVLRVHGPVTTGFTLFSLTTLDQLTYDTSLPGASAFGGGDYVEINTFQNTVYLNGDADDMKPGIDIPISDFFPLEVGVNELEFLGDGTCHMLWNHAYAN